MATAKQKAAARRNLVKARAARKRRQPSLMHGSGTGLSSGYRYLPSVVERRWNGRGT